MDNKNEIKLGLDSGQDNVPSALEAQRTRGYEKPAVVFRTPLEAMAATCSPSGKTVAGQSGCSFAQS